MIYNSCYICVLLILLELINSLNGRPQRLRPRVNLDFGIINYTVQDKTENMFREAVEPKTSNKIKERILNTGTIPFGELSEQNIIFPDTYELDFEPLVPAIYNDPRCAEGGTFCEKYDSYPYLPIKDILRRHNVNKNFFSGAAEMSFENRIGVDEETSVCGAITKVVFPLIGKNKNDEWQFIVNLGKDYVQGVHTETCSHGGKPCDVITDLPDGFRTSCEQKYTYTKLLSVKGKRDMLLDNFRFPSACCCSYKKDFEFLSRFGKAVTPVKYSYNKKKEIR